MNTVSNILFWISNGLLVPVVILLLLFFLKAILSIVGFFVFWGAVGSAMEDSFSNEDINEFIDEYKDFLDDYGIDIEESIPGAGDSAEQL